LKGGVRLINLSHKLIYKRGLKQYPLEIENPRIILSKNSPGSKNGLYRVGVCERLAKLTGNK